MPERKSCHEVLTKGLACLERLRAECSGLLYAHRDAIEKDGGGWTVEILENCMASAKTMPSLLREAQRIEPKGPAIQSADECGACKMAALTGREPQHVHLDTPEIDEAAVGEGPMTVTEIRSALLAAQARENWDTGVIESYFLELGLKATHEGCDGVLCERCDSNEPVLRFVEAVLREAAALDLKQGGEAEASPDPEPNAAP